MSDEDKVFPKDFIKVANPWELRLAKIFGRRLRGNYLHEAGYRVWKWRGRIYVDETT